MAHADLYFSLRAIWPGSLPQQSLTEILLATPVVITSPSCGSTVDGDY